MDLDILIEDPRWSEIALEALARDALAAVAAHLDVDRAVLEVSVLACDDRRIAMLNADFRDKPHPTNVLSWPAEELSAAAPGARPSNPATAPDGSISLGDMALAYETCAREARAMKKSLSEHVSHLIVHGSLHLLGYDHVDDADAALMEATEVEILGILGLDDPY